MPLATQLGMTHRNVSIWIFALIVAVAAGQSCEAGSASLVVNGRSLHLGSDYDWNENNAGIGIEYQLEQRSAWRRIAMANGFRDSTNSMSYMAGVGLHRRLFETDKMAGFHVYAGLNAFLMTREDVNGSRAFPGVLPSLTVGNRVVGVNLTYLPRLAVERTTGSTMVDPDISGILFMQVKVSLDRLLPR